MCFLLHAVGCHKLHVRSRPQDFTRQDKIEFILLVYEFKMNECVFVILATDVMALFATNVSCVYLLSWVILHEQFVGIRIVAVILCDTGIALLAYMDGITGSPTLGGVVLAASAAAGSAVYKVLFRKAVGGDATYAQVIILSS